MHAFRHWRRASRNCLTRLFGVGAALSLGVAALAVGTAKPAAAAEDLVFTYGTLTQSFNIEELEEFAETGEVPSKWRFYFNITGVEPEVIQTILSQEFKVSLKLADDALNTIPGEFALFSIGQVIHTRSRQANIQALRSAFVLSVADDGTISVLEFLKTYPLQQIYIDGVEVAKVARDVSQAVEEIEEVARRLEAYWAIAKEFLAEFICDCETTSLDVPDDMPRLEAWIESSEAWVARPDDIPNF